MSEQETPVVGAVPPEPTMPGAESQAAPAPPIGVTVFPRAVEVSEGGGKRRLQTMPDEDQLNCHPDIMEVPK